VRAIAPTGTLAAVEYWVTDTGITRLPRYNLTPSGCPNELVYEVKQENGSALPSSIQFDNTPGSETITVFTSSYSATGTYSVAVKVTDPKTGLTNTAQKFQVVIKCTKTINISAGTIASFSYQIDLSNSWNKDTALPTF